MHGSRFLSSPPVVQLPLLTLEFFWRLLTLEIFLPHKMSGEKNMIPTFSEKTRYKRKYHCGLKIPCINAMLVWISEEQNKWNCKDMKVDELYKNRHGEMVSIPLYFSQRLSNFFHTYIYPDVVVELWPIVTSVLRYIHYENTIWGRQEYEKVYGKPFPMKEENWFEEIGKEYIFLKNKGYNPTKIPFAAVNRNNL